MASVVVVGFDMLESGHLVTYLSYPDDRVIRDRLYYLKHRRPIVRPE